MDGYLKGSLRRERSSTKLFGRRRSSLSPSEVSPRASEHQWNGFKPKSPLRQSFRNLISAFKRTTSKNKVPEELPDYHPDPPTLKPVRRKAAPRLPSLERNQTGRTSTSSNGPSTLWYLCRDPDKLMDSSPWVPCDAIVGTDKVAVTWISALGTPVGHNIDLTRCSDVRSLSFDQLEAKEQDLLLQRGEEHDYKVFEILFEGKARRNLQRLLLGNELAGSVPYGIPSSPPRIPRGPAPRTEVSPPSAAISPPTTTTSPIPSPVPRSLPTIPDHDYQAFVVVQEKKPMQSSETNAEAPVLADETASTTRSLSVFKRQRPQPLEQTSSQSSQSSTNTRTSRFSQSTCVTTPDADSVSGEKSTAMARTGSRESSRIAHSIIDSYRRSIMEPNEPESAAVVSEVAPMMFTTRSRLETIAESLYNLSAHDDEPAEKSFKARAEEPQQSEVMVHLAQTVDANHELTTLVHQKLGAFLNDYTDSTGSMTAGIRSVHEKLAELKLPGRGSGFGTNTMEADQPRLDSPDLHQLKLLNTRLDEILEAIQMVKPLEGMPMQKELSDQLKKILNLLKEDRSRRELVAEQQNESVRYLNELNQWFESFVQNGTSHFQGLSAGVDKLSQVLCENSDNPGLVSELRQMNQEREVEMRKIDVLHCAVSNLLAVVSRNAGSNDIPQVAELIERQRQDQMVLVQYLAHTISEEIRGERLRFVEAMKEATAINVQGHVEHFKEELKREVKTMNEEVGRLHQARQAMQNQIADLFGFYDKHNRPNAPAPPRGPAMATRPRSQESQHQHRIPRASQFRPLPHPRAP